MVLTCPQCQLKNPSRAETCLACGRKLTPQDATDSSEVNIGGSLSTAPTWRVRPPSGSEGPETRAAHLSAPLPAPMVEAIVTPTPRPPDSKPLPPVPALSLSLGGASRAEPSPTTPTNTPTAEIPPPTPDIVLPRPKLVVLRGQRVNQEYPIYEGRNTIGRFVDKPVDIDLIAQESEIQTWCSRLHAAIVLNKGQMYVEDLNSLNGTWLNGTRIMSGNLRPLQPNDVLQVGTVQLKVVVG